MTEKVPVSTWSDVSGMYSTEEIRLPTDPLDRVLGQHEAIEMAKIAAKQRRNLLLVGPPGTGKSMIAQALSLNLPKPEHEVRVVMNPENSERPLLEVVDSSDVLIEQDLDAETGGKLLDPEHAPTNVAERLGFKCKNCGAISEPEELICPDCQTSKVNMGPNSQFADLFGSLMESFGGQVSLAGRERVNTTRTLADGTEETVVFERAGDKIRMLDQKALENRRKIRSSKNKKVLVKLTRNPFVMATGSSEAELLGDVLHDPYGGHEKLGSPAYQRVVPGAVHEAHEGVLFIDEISHLGNLQRYILTAMQDKAFPITGHNPQSAGASVRVDAVPCDFILVAACNIQDIEKILSPLRSRIIGNGYEVLVDIAMPDTDENRAMYAQFVAQEVQKDGHIPHAEIPAVEELIKEGRRRAKLDGQVSSLTLRLREMGGLIRAAGDLAVMNGDDIITAQHVKDALKRAMPVEEQIKKRYGSYTKGLSQDVTSAQKETSQYYFQNEHIPDDSMFN